MAVLEHVVSVKGMPRGGVKVDGQMDAAQVLEMGRLTFNVSKVPLFTSEGQKAPAYATVRQDTGKVLGIVGERYTILQNSESFRFFDGFVSRKEAQYVAAGSINGGATVWLLARLPGDIRVLGQDITEKLLLLSNSHDGTGAVSIRFIPRRLACFNVISAALNGRIRTSYSIRHTQHVHEAVAQAHRVMGISSIYYDELQQAFAAMAQTRLNGAETRDFLERCFAKEAA